MTSLEQLVPSLSLCRQLQAAGFPQDTALKWVCDDDGSYVIPTRSDEIVLADLCAAPTAEEILKELPRTILKGQIYVLEVHRRGDILDVWEVDWYFNGLQLAASTTMTICQKESEAAVGAYLWWKKEVAGWTTT